MSEIDAFASPLFVQGTVETGDRRGRLLGFPTANIPLRAEDHGLADGVYAGIAVTDDIVRPTAVSVGRRPTFYENGWVLVEAHLLDFDVDIYGHRLELFLTHRLRDQRRFNGVDELISQLRTDVAAVRRVDPIQCWRALDVDAARR